MFFLGRKASRTDAQCPTLLLPPRRIYFIRHGQTTFNVCGKFQGRSQLSELTPTGVLGARLAGRHLVEIGCRPDAVYSSQLKRAKQSVAEICSVYSPDLRATETALLNERDVGRMQDLTQIEIDATLHMEPAIAALIAKKTSMSAPEYDRLYGELTGVETFDCLRIRAQSFLDMVATASTHKIVVAVSHGRFLSTLFAMLEPSRRTPHDDMSNCTITTVEFDESGETRWRIAAQYDGSKLFEKHMLAHNSNAQLCSDNWLTQQDEFDNHSVSPHRQLKRPRAQPLSDGATITQQPAITLHADVLQHILAFSLLRELYGSQSHVSRAWQCAVRSMPSVRAWLRLSKLTDGQLEDMSRALSGLSIIRQANGPEKRKSLKKMRYALRRDECFAASKELRALFDTVQIVRKDVEGGQGTAFLRFTLPRAPATAASVSSSIGN